MFTNTISDYKKCEAWGPWQEQDTTMTFTYTEQTSGVGANYSWTSRDGPGSMKTLAARRKQIFNNKN